MGSISVHEFVSLDGVFENPSWTADFGFDTAMGETLAEVTGGADAILLGRRTFEMFAPAWRDRTPEDDPGAPFFNDSTKYVVSGTLTDPAAQWANSEQVDVAAVADLRQRCDLYVSGSGTLVRSLLADGLVDDLHLFVYPVVLGEGARLFPDGTGRSNLALKDSTAYANGVLHLRYGPAA